MQNDCVHNRGDKTQVNCALVEYGMLLSYESRSLKFASLALTCHLKLELFTSKKLPEFE